PGLAPLSGGGVFAGFCACAPSAAVAANMPATARPDQYRFIQTSCSSRVLYVAEQPADHHADEHERRGEHTQLIGARTTIRSMQLDKRTVLVTGGASGLGGATVDMVVAAGGRAVIVDINEEAGRAKSAQHGDRVRFVRADVTSEEDMQRAIDVAVREIGGLHGLVNAAGIAVAERVLPREGVQPLAHFVRTIQINLVGTFNAIRLAAAAMAGNEPTSGGERGVIVNTASVA